MLTVSLVSSEFPAYSCAMTYRGRTGPRWTGFELRRAYTHKRAHTPARTSRKIKTSAGQTLDLPTDSGANLTSTPAGARVLTWCTCQMGRHGVFQGFIIRMQASLSVKGQNEIQTWCWDSRAEEVACQGHWAQQMVVFDASPVAPGDVVVLDVDVDSSVCVCAHARVRACVFVCV